MNPLEILQTTFGYSAFKGCQEAIIEQVIQGGDALVLMPTGGGKSLCYQIPAMVRGGTGVVVSPLIALMKDQVDALRQLGIRAAYINSSLHSAEIYKVEQQLLDSQLDLLYIAPERLLTGRSLTLLNEAKIALFAIDEAHCVSQWGHDFRKEYQQLSLLHERYPEVPRIALTATADDRTRVEIISQLRLDQAAVFISSFDRPNIRYTLAEGANGRAQLWKFLEAEHPNDAGIVYCLSRKKVESVADWLASQGRNALPYHAGLDAGVRQRHQERFLREDSVIIVATIAFGMGIDKPDVRFVAHLSLPKSIEAYYQETGRAGRDGQPANAWMAYGLQDVILLRQMVQGSDADERFKQVQHHKLEALLGLCELTTCRRQALLQYFGETLIQPCGNCDNCLNAPATWEGSVAAQKALSCVYRTGQRYGVNYIVEVLSGKDDQRIRRNGHDRISTYGIGAELTQVEWRSVFRQLIVAGYLNVDLEGYGALHLTETCRPLLRGETSIQFRKQGKPEARKEKEAKRKQPLRLADEMLWEALRKRRSDLAEEHGVPPYVIFHDTTLKEMVHFRPPDLEAIGRIPGIGQYKLQQYGQEFLAVIRQFPLPELLQNKLNDTTNDTLYLYSQGIRPEPIAEQRGLKVSTIYSHLAEAIAAGLLEAKEVLQLSETDYALIEYTINACSEAREGRLKLVYEELDSTWDYGILRCVWAGMHW